MKILSVIHAMEMGGAERVTALLLNEFVERGHQVRLVTFHGSESFFPLDKRITQSPLCLSTRGLPWFKKLPRLLRLSHSIRREVKKNQPDVVISNMDSTNLLVLISLIGLPTPTIVFEHTAPQYSSITKIPFLGAFANNLRTILYHRAAQIVVLTKDAREHFSKTLQRKCVDIPNPIQVPALKARTSEDQKILLSAGRLIEVKRHRLLIEAFSSISEKFPNWNLRLVGDGPLREDLEKLTAKKGLTPRVTFAGAVQDVSSEYQKADLFAFPSQVEGFGCALAEAMSYGIPAVASDCPVGPREIITNEIDGFLVPVEDRGAFEAALIKLMSDSSLREKFSSAARESSKRFELRSVVDRWEKLFLELTNSVTDR